MLTTTNLSILVPHRANYPERDRNWAWAKARYRKLMPEAEIVEGDSGDEPFCLSRTVNRLAESASGQVFIFANSDVVIDTHMLEIALHLLGRGVPWVVPFFYYHRLTAGDTERLLTLDPAVSMATFPHKPEWITAHFTVGALNLITRENFYKAGGYDERFINWGFNDFQFQAAADTLCGTHQRLNGIIYHLWHPAPEGDTRQNPHYADNKQLMGRYRKAYGNCEAMRDLITEGKGAAHCSEPTQETT